MDRGVYQAVLEKLVLPTSASPHFKAIAELFGVSIDTVYSIYSQEVQARVIKTHNQLKASSAANARRYLAGEDLLLLCYEADLPPCIVLRRLLEQLPLGLQQSRRVTELLRDPPSLPSLVARETARQALAAAGVEAGDAAAGALLGRLQADVELAVQCDRVYSPTSDAARHAAGLEYEAKLYQGLSAAGLAYWTEVALRMRGFHKTPDARLQVPVAVQGHVVCWIDSKATFGDERQHRQQLREQYQRYVNRFGPGLVIYWHGYLAELQAEDDGVLLMDRFPSAEELLVLPKLPLGTARVLFCGRDMHFAYEFTRQELGAATAVDVVQCDREAVREELLDADVAVPLMAPLDATALQSARRLKLILQYGAGVEGIDIRAATELGIWVSNIPSAATGNATSCAEMALYLVLSTLRNPKAMEESIQHRRLGVPLGSMLQGKHVLLIGFGSIAKNVVARLRPFGVTLSALRRSSHWGGAAADALTHEAEAALTDRGTWPGDTARLAAAADVVVVTCKQDASNVGMVGSEFLSHCKEGVRIVNVARGGLLDYEAVAEGLRSGKIGGMGLDVQWREPVDPDDYVSRHPSVHLTPHVAGVTEQSYRAMAKVVAGEVLRVREGRPPTVQLNCPRRPVHCHEDA